MSVTPDSTFTNPEQLIADLQRQLVEYRAELDKAQRHLNETTTERDDALARETATAEVLEVINSSPGDLAPIFDAILDKAHALCGAANGGLLIRDGEVFRIAAFHGEPSFLEIWRQTFPGRAPENAPLARIVGGARIVHLTDALADESYRTAPVPIQRLLEAGAIHTALWVPLRKDGTLLGVINAFRQEVRPFTDKQIALLQNFAAQAVIAIENTRLLTETREALEQQTATAEILRVISRSPTDLQPTFDAIACNATTLSGAAAGMVFRYDGSLIHFAASYGLPPDTLQLSQQSFPQPPGRQSTTTRAILTREVVHVADVAADPEYALPAVVQTGWHTALAVPVLQDGNPVGVITVARREVAPFSQAQIDLLKTFADQAVIAIENVRLFNDTREALEQQTATAEVLQVINSSPGDLAPVFDAILERATQVCEAAFGVMNTYDGERFHTAAMHRLPPALAEMYGRDPPPPGPHSPLTLIAQGQDVVSIDDLTVGPGADLPRRRILIEQGGARSWVAVALRRDGALLGAISAYRTEVRPFSNQQVALLQNFAAQAVIAMENARLLGELRQRTRDLEESLEYQTATGNVLQAISRSTFDLQPVLDTLVKTAARLCNADLAGIATRNDEIYKVTASYSASPEWDTFVRALLLRPGRDTVTGRALLERQAIQIADITADAEYKVPETATIGSIRTNLGVPLLREGEPIGVMQLSRTHVEPFTERQIELVRTFADQAVIAMENARLLGELRQRTEEVAELNRGLEARVAEQVEELGRVSRLKRFLAPQLAELIVSQGDEEILESHRREIVVVFCDLRGYTAFTETAEPEEVLDFLREYHGALGPLVSQFEGTLDQFSGDGIMVFFNDPVPIPDPAKRAVRMSMVMREAASALISGWRRLGRDLGFGAGIAQGYATLGQIGFSERSGYTAIGTVCNVAARLCAEAKDGQILLSQRVAARLDDIITVEEIGALTLKGLTQPVIAYNVPLIASQPALRVIEGGGPPTV